MGSRRTRGDRRKPNQKLDLEPKDTKIEDYVNPYLQDLESGWVK